MFIAQLAQVASMGAPKHAELQIDWHVLDAHMQLFSTIALLAALPTQTLPEGALPVAHSLQCAQHVGALHE